MREHYGNSAPAIAAGACTRERSNFDCGLRQTCKLWRSRGTTVLRIGSNNDNHPTAGLAGYQLDTLVFLAENKPNSLSDDAHKKNLQL
jgi:hypothetical protein